MSTFPNQLVISQSHQSQIFPKPHNQYLQRKTLWDADPYLSNNIIMSNTKRRSRWSSQYSKTFTPLPVTSIPKNIEIDEFENLLRKQRINDISNRLSSNKYEDEDPDLREPSPEPIYDNKTGKRINTREVINRENYLREKNDIITELIKYDKKYQIPHDYKPPKKNKKIYIKLNDKYNFTRYIIGPKGKNIKKLENQSKCKISIRGKGSSFNNTTNYLDEQEPLHILIQAEKEEELNKGEELILPFLDENSEEYKKAKMELVLSYNYNNNEPACEFCGERGHKSWACPMNIGQFDKVEIICKFCGDRGHPSCDCPFKPTDENEGKISELDLLFRNAENIKKKSDIRILREEIKKSDIWNSVLITGKINVKRNNNGENNNNNNNCSLNNNSSVNNQEKDLNIKEEDDDIKVETIK
jgi:splicing factor 1